jgi:hypothetical protein
MTPSGKPKHVGAFIVYFNVNFNIFKQIGCALAGLIKDWINIRTCKSPQLDIYWARWTEYTPSYAISIGFNNTLTSAPLYSERSFDFKFCDANCVNASVIPSLRDNPHASPSFSRQSWYYLMKSKFWSSSLRIFINSHVTASFPNILLSRLRSNGLSLWCVMSWG